MWETDVILGASHALVLRGWAPESPKFRTILHTPTLYDKEQPNFAWRSNQIRGDFYTVDHAPCPGKMLHECRRAICLR